MVHLHEDISRYNKKFKKHELLFFDKNTWYLSSAISWVGVLNIRVFWLNNKMDKNYLLNRYIYVFFAFFAFKVNVYRLQAQLLSEKVMSRAMR